MAGHKVDLTRLAEMIDRIGTFDEQLQSAMGDAQSRVDRLHTTWTGDAATAHLRAHQEWVRGVADMRAALSIMRRNAQIAHDNYTSAATANADMWRQAL